ncbi:hypothetical protein FRC01_001618 [Tulasnella sp. 417]|nr:hypothetical protein FRC01_001618 [Tulasnella sp. 417]
MTFCINNLLPAEILSLIFLTLYHQSSSAPFPPLDREQMQELREHPLLETMLVCRAWQRVVSTTPALWTTIWVGRTKPVEPESVAETGSKAEPDPWLEKLQNRLKRSGKLPLNILIALDRLVNFDKVVDVLVQDALRWESVYLAHEDPAPMFRLATQSFRDVERLLSLPMPLLKSLHLERFRTPDGTLALHTININNPLPCLERLSCTGHLITLMSAPRLTTVTLTDVDMERLHPPPEPCALEFASLANVSIINSNHVLDILSIFPAPSLRKLITDSSTDVYDDQPQKPIPAFPVFPNLEELQWTDKGGDHQALKHLLRKSPNLRRFSNYVHGLEDSIDFDMSATTIPVFLTPSSHPEPSNSDQYCSNLEDVCFDIVDCSQIEKFVSVRSQIKQVRLLQNPIENPELSGTSDVQQILDRLRTRTSVVLGTGSWS